MSRLSAEGAREQPSRVLLALLLLYTAASLLHFVHNAEYLSDYPNLPAAFSRLLVYGVWCLIAAIGVCGYLLYRRGHARIGLAVLALYAALGLDGLLHYGRAPMSAHSAGMNLTIWTEVIAAAALLVAIATIALRGRAGNPA